MSAVSQRDSYSGEVRNANAVTPSAWKGRSGVGSPQMSPAASHSSLPDAFHHLANPVFGKPGSELYPVNHPKKLERAAYRVGWSRRRLPEPQDSPLHFCKSFNVPRIQQDWFTGRHVL